MNTDPDLFAFPVEVEVKSNLISEMFNIVGFNIPQVSGELELTVVCVSDSL